MPKDIYQEIIEWDKREVFKQLEVLEFWLLHNDLPKRELKKLWQRLDDLSDIIFHKYDAKKK